MVDADGIEVFDGAFQAGNAVLDAVGVGGLDKIKAFFLERQRQCLRRAEVRTAAVRLAAEVQLQIADREVRAHRQRRNSGEAVGKIVASVCLLCGVDLLVIDHDVADGGKCNNGVRLRIGDLRGGRVLHRDGLRLAARVLSALAAACDQHDREDQDHNEHAENDALLKPAAALLLQTAQTALLQHLVVTFKIW